MKHTPGPWTVESVDAGTEGWAYLIQEEEAAYYEANRSDDDALMDAANEAHAANVTLIAEAPAMLEALRRMRYRLIDAIEDSGYSVVGPTVWGAEDGYPKWVASARAEIAEAQAIIKRIEG